MPATGVIIMPSVNTQVGLTTELIPVFVPFDATNREVSWTSTDEEVVTVDHHGVVTAVGARVGHPLDGYVDMDSAYIRVEAADGGHYDYSLFRVLRSFPYNCNDITNRTLSGGTAHFFGGLPGGTTGNPGEVTPTFEFHPGQTMTVGNQVWSTPVFGCVRGATANFTGVIGAAGATAGGMRVAGGTFNADCRRNINFQTEGDLYSWCAVMRFGHLMCPYPWRIPYAEDFAILDKAIRADIPGQEFRSGWESYVSEEVVAEFIRVWRVPFSGMILTGQNAMQTPPAGISGRGAFGAYWTQTEHSPNSAYFFYIGSGGQIHPQHPGVKSAGRTVRCVRDI